MPDYVPSIRYPQLHPLGDNTDDDASCVKDPNCGSGWIPETSHTNTYTNAHANTYTNAHANTPASTIQAPCTNNTKEICDDLINRVLTNQYCRRILRKLLLDKESDEDEVDAKKLPPFKPICEGFTSQTQFLDPETIKNIFIYCIGGLILLCAMELVFKIGHLTSRAY